MSAKKVSAVPHSVLAPVKTPLRAVAAFSFFGNILLLAPSIYMLQIYDRVLSSRSTETLVMLTIVVVALLVVQGVLEKIRSRLLVRTGTAMELSLRDVVIAQQFRHSLNAGRTEHAGVKDLRELRAFIGGPALIALLDSPWVPVYVFVIFMLHPLLGAIAVGGAFFLFGLAFWNDRRTRAPLKAAEEAGGRYNGDVNNALRNVDSIEAMGMLPVLLKRWRARGDATIAPAEEAGERTGSVTAVAKFFRQAIQIGVLAAGVMLTIDNQATAGVMMAASILLGRALAPVENAIGNWKSAVSAWGAIVRLNATLREVRDIGAAMTLPPPTGKLEVAALQYAHPRREAPCVLNISFNLRPGEALGIMGPSGCGKSTLLKLLVGAVRPATGTIRLDGADLEQWGEARGSHIGYLPQDVQLFDGTVWENICRMQPEPDSAEIVRAARVAHAHDMILRLPDGYETQVGIAGSQLSGGQQRLIALARCLYGSPRVVMLDEPSANLDSDGEQAVRQAVARMKEYGTTLIVVSHQLSILHGVDTLMLMKQGTVARYGPRAEVLRELQVVQGSGAAKPQPAAAPAAPATAVKRA